MKNKVELKNALIISSLIIIIFNIIFIIENYFEYRTYTNNFNKKIEGIFETINEKYPNVDKSDLVEILNTNNTSNIKSFLRDYGIDIEEDSVILQNDKYFKTFLITNIVTILIFCILLLTTFLKYNHSKDKKLQEITQYIEEINKRNYKLDIDDNTEDELSILKNEIYKTTVMLKEQAENSLKDKVNLKDSLSDISHQLKTPLTSVIIMLDNIIDNKNMEQNTKEEFINDIKREIININFLVQSILKLSKFDANTIDFINKKVYVRKILDEAVKNVSTLCDLKDIQITINGDKNNTIICDEKWQVEALTNILKNCVEYSKKKSEIQIKYEQNKIYTEILIRDTGDGIDEQDLPHIFERFYKGKNSSKDSVGIGLALAKTIIEKNNGSINVTSEIKNGSTFVIRYFK